MTTDTDRIERHVVIDAPVERVWDLVTGAEHLGRWFGDAGAAVDLRPGGALSFTWREHGTVHGRVEVVEPPRRFAYRWLTTAGVQSDPVPGNSTRAEFTLVPEGAGTRVTVVETGFAVLEGDPADRTRALAEHTRGWELELADLVEHATATAAAR